MTNIENLCLNLATVGPQFGFTEVLDAGLKHGFSTVSPWRHHYEAIGVGAAAKETRARGVKVDTVCRISGFGPAVSGAQWSAALDEAKATIEEAVTLQARAIIYPGGGVGEGSTIEDARKRILDGLAQIAPMAHEAGILILVEPLHPVVTADRGAINTLGFALDLCDAVSEGTGVAVDSYNVWWDPQLEASMARAGTRVQGFQISDWLITTRHTAFDRGMVGDGVIDFRRIRSLVDGTGYAGPIEIEVLSEKDWWARDLDTVLSTARARINLHLGEAQ